MRSPPLQSLALAVFVLLGVDTTVTADDFVIDAVHSGVNFKISHLDLAYVHGRFDSFSGKFTIDTSDPAKSSFALSIKPETVDTNNMGRDTHLRGPDFFNVKQYPVISFTSTSVKPSEGGYEVTGNLTLHGATKPITFSLKGGKNAEFPPGVKRTGYSTGLCSNDLTSAWASRCRSWATISLSQSALKARKNDRHSPVLKGSFEP